jgi:eukaryotic-like serine/threonine-protein kinase
MIAHLLSSFQKAALTIRENLQDALGDTYHIDGEIGGGGMSKVFSARETSLGRAVAIKVLSPELGAGVDIERFRREIQLAANLQHPHIVPLLAAGESRSLLYYTMPLVRGESLRALLDRTGRLEIADAVRYMRDIVEALAHAHERGVVHRDIKPENILVAERHAMVADFGVAKALSAATSETVRTSLGLALGTPLYMAPEQVAADPATDHRADLYSLGVVGYEMLAGRPPFRGRNAHGVMAAHAMEAPAPIRRERPEMPASLSHLIMQCLEKDPDLRPASASEVLRILERHSTATPKKGLPRFASSITASWWLWTAVVAAVLLAVLWMAGLRT